MKPIKVKDLIEELEKLDPELDLWVRHLNRGVGWSCSQMAPWDKDVKVFQEQTVTHVINEEKGNFHTIKPEMATHWRDEIGESKKVALFATFG